MIIVEQLPQTAPPVVLEPPPPPPLPQKTTGTGLPPVQPPPEMPPPAYFHAGQWCYAIPLALNLFMATIIALVSGLVIPLYIALGGLIIPAVGYAIERRRPPGTPERSSIARRVLLLEFAFLVIWEAGMYLWWPRGV